MNTKKKERRVINLNKENFDIIKTYCDNNALKMSDWISLKIIEIIIKNENGEK